MLMAQIQSISFEWQHQMAKRNTVMNQQYKKIPHQCFNWYGSKNDDIYNDI